MSKSHNEDPKSKTSPIRLVKPKPNIRLAEKLLPTEDTAPGKYLAGCDSVWLKRMSDYTEERKATFQFRLIDGKHGGIGLRMWIDKAIDEAGNVYSDEKYAQACKIALGRPLEESDPILKPEEIFAGHRFIVFVGYRKSKYPGGKGGPSRDEWAMIHKDPDDFLRVHDIISREDW